ncbi:MULTISPECIES: type II toxin-antitoxin system HipA family toxin [Niastella]|uniref:HipA domain-containing protein n=1 Tax=Niastella soli TaxID=2821487 RepID=A0ABS3YNY5_9BACT|nr:HipA domain-containing protein [Niastella soli]MBO9199543.1 HipA domain-containing protein [Niastella soli]
MSKSTHQNQQILVYADWIDLGGIILMGTLQAEQVRGKEVFSFSYTKEWLEKGSALIIDPDLGLYSGPQYSRDDKPNFGLFMDSSPDRWGRVLMERREAFAARQEKGRPKPLMESDFLLGVFDQYRMGGLRFKLKEDGPFLDANEAMAAPPMTSLRTLEEASLQLEKDDAMEDPSYAKWLNLLISPGSSLGGARPKASVIDPNGELWIAKFPSRKDDRDIGGWETVVNELAIKSGLSVAEGKARRFTQDYHTFLTKRFDRVGNGRIHFASAMTLLGHTDGADGAAGVSYLHLAEYIMRYGAQPNTDLEELWRRIVFNICVSNSDDHLRNHGFLLTPQGWMLSPAFDINPIPLSTGLSLNISEHSNELDLDLAREVGEKFRLDKVKREEIINRVTKTVSHWKEVAGRIGISRGEMISLESAFIH